ncbi:MAG: hypothetical protein COB02_02800 [Candidatus Cloacimonadota bacterium]|nr:MAG: hypothetical protein COB02_02800 [Candidatus Cloacimonadota bacterium]
MVQGYTRRDLEMIRSRGQIDAVCSLKKEMKRCVDPVLRYEIEETITFLNQLNNPFAIDYFFPDEMKSPMLEFLTLSFNRNRLQHQAQMVLFCLLSIIFITYLFIQIKASNPDLLIFYKKINFLYQWF